MLNYPSFKAAYDTGANIHAYIILDGLRYEESEIILDSIRLTGDLYSEDAAGIGGVCSREIEFQVFPKDAQKYSQVDSIVGEPIIDTWYEYIGGKYVVTTDTVVAIGKVYYEETGEATPKSVKSELFLYINSSAYPKGKYYVSFDSRDAITGVYTYKGADFLSRLNKAYAVEKSEIAWPNNPLEVVNEIARLNEFEIDPRTLDYFNREVIPGGKFTVGYPGANEGAYTYRDMLSFIGVMLGGNWTSTDEGKLYFIRLQQETPVIAHDLQQDMESLDLKRRSVAIGGIQVDLGQSDAVTGEELYREYIPYTICSENETTVKRGRLYFERIETMFTPVDLSVYTPEELDTLNPHDEGWFVQSSDVDYHPDGDYYEIPVNPAEEGWFEYNATEQAWTPTGDTSVLARYFRWYSGVTNSAGNYLQGEYLVEITNAPQTQSFTFRQNTANLVMVGWGDSDPPVYDAPVSTVGADITFTHTYNQNGTYTMRVLVDAIVLEAHPDSAWWVTSNGRPSGAILVPFDFSKDPPEPKQYAKKERSQYIPIDINDYRSSAEDRYVIITLSDYADGAEAIPSEPGSFYATYHDIRIDPIEEDWYEFSDTDRTYVETYDRVVKAFYFNRLPDGGGNYTIKTTAETLTQTITFHQQIAELIEVDWGDGSSRESSALFEVTMSHEYESASIYPVRLYVKPEYATQSSLWWVDQRPEGSLLYGYKSFYSRESVQVPEERFVPTEDIRVETGTQYYAVANYERLNVGADELKRGVNPSANQWYEYDEEHSREGTPIFVLTEDTEIQELPRTYDYFAININDYYDDVNPHEKEWYEYDKNAVQYIPTADTEAPIRYWSEWDMGQRVVYKLDLTGASYYTQRVEIRQSLPNLVQVDWGDPSTPEEERIETDSEHTWTGSPEDSTATFSHSYANAGTYALTLMINPEVVAANPDANVWWDVASRPANTIKYCDKNYYEQAETTIQAYKYYYHRIEPEYKLIDPSSYENQNPYINRWYRRTYGDKIITGVCPWATDDGVKAVFENVLKGFRYQAYEASSALLPPMVELGDLIKLNGTVTIFAHCDVTIGIQYAPDISAPGDSDVYDSESSSSMSFTERTMSTKIANAMSAANDKQATELSTTRRVVLYLDNNTSDDNYFRVQNEMTEWVSGVVVFDEEERPKVTQHRTVNGTLLYWNYTDGSSEKNRDIRKAAGISSIRSNGYPMTEGNTRLTMTTVETCFPVYIYQYFELTKASLGFEKENNDTYLPVLRLGAGDRNNDNYAVIKKPVDGLKILYNVPKQNPDDPDEPEKDIGIIAGREGFLDLLGVRRTDAMDFSAWNSGLFTETIEGRERSAVYHVVFDLQGRPVKIVDEDEHETVITW